MPDIVDPRGTTTGRRCRTIQATGISARLHSFPAPGIVGNSNIDFPGCHNAQIIAVTPVDIEHGLSQLRGFRVTLVGQQRGLMADKTISGTMKVVGHDIDEIQLSSVFG